MGNTIFLRRGRQWASVLGTERGRRVLELAAYFLGGFFLAAGALMGDFQPLALGLLCAGPNGWPAVCAALGGCAGYLTFWGTRAVQGIGWMAGGIGVAALAGGRGICQRQRLLLPALAAVVVSGCGVLFLLRFGDQTPVDRYLLRIAVGMGTTGVFQLWRERREGVTRWLAQGIFVLALAQVMPVRYLGLGYAAAGFLGAGETFPGAVMAGLALDLAQVTRVPMTAVLCLGYCLRLIPRQPRWFALVCPALGFVPVAVASGVWDVLPLPGLVLGGALAGFFPGLAAAPRPVHRQGETAVAQVRLEQMSLVLRQMEQALMLAREPTIDRQAVLSRAVEAACDTCPERRQCKARALAGELPPQILEQPGLSGEDVPKLCRKQTRFLTELRRGQEQLRRMKAQRSRTDACRAAVREQYGFLSEFLQGLSDDLAQCRNYVPPKFRADVGMSTRSRREVNGDTCVWFSGTRNRYYILLCDGMGTGEAALRESREASDHLQRLLSIGFPAEYALRNLNSMAILREMGGCATVDLVQLDLNTGRGLLYKWGAAGSYLLHRGQLRKIGTAGAPPGLSQQARETVDRLSLGGGEVLVLLSDGAGEEGLLQRAWMDRELSPGEMAASILEQGSDAGDDATVVVIRLHLSGTSTQ